MVQQGQVFKLKGRTAEGRPLWAYRYRLQGRGSRRVQVGGFASRVEAQQALEKALARLRPGGWAATLTLSEFVDEYLQAHPRLPVTVSKLRWLLCKATAALGDVRLVDLTPEQVCSWRMTIPEGHPYEATQALRQVLNRAVAWEVLDSNPAKRGVPNPLRRSLEKRPFDSWQQVEAVAAHLGPVYGPMVVFAAATGLRPAELFALEHRDLDFRDGLVYVRRAYANGRVKHVKTRRSMRGVPLQGMALEALRRLPPNPTTPLVFPNARGGYIDLHNFRQRHWRPALSAAGIEPLRQPYDLRDPTLGWPLLTMAPIGRRPRATCGSQHGVAASLRGRGQLQCDADECDPHGRALREHDHQRVAWAGSEPCRHVEAAADADQPEPDDGKACSYSQSGAR
jgi:integrase